MTQIYIIAEMAYSHDGSIALAQDIIDAAADAGADAISMHFTHMPDYMVRHYGAGPGRVSAGKDTQPVYDYLCEISPSFDDWASVVAYAKVKGQDVIVMPNDWASLTFAETISPAAYVLSAACFEEYDFISAIGETGRPVYLRVGGATLGEIETVIALLRKAGNSSITLLYGHQNYPTQVSDTNLNFLTCLKNTFGLPVGIADHVDADEDFATIAPLLAVPLGVTCIEKHITHDRAKKGEDFESALNGDELALLIRRVRQSEEALGLKFAEGLDESSSQYRTVARKRLVAARDIQAGETLNREDIAAKRADEGESPVNMDKFIGRKLAIDITMDQGLLSTMLRSEG